MLPSKVSNIFYAYTFNNRFIYAIFFKFVYLLRPVLLALLCFFFSFQQVAMFCWFVCCLRSRLFCSYEYATIDNEGLHNLDLYSSPTAI